MLLHLRRQLLIIQLLEPTHALRVISDNPYIGKTFLCLAYYDNQRIINGITWSIISGIAYATINENGKVFIQPGTVNQEITIQAIAKGLTATKTITISYDNEVTIESADTITGTSGNALAKYNGEYVNNAQWAVVSGSAYGTINALGEITIIDSGTIVISATYEGVTGTKGINLVYLSNALTETTVDPETGATTTTTTVTETDPETGSTTTTETSTTTNTDGSVTDTSTTTVENQDGSSTTTSTITNSDGSASSTETNVNSDGSSSTTTTQTNTDGTSSETESSTTAPDPITGSTTTESTTTNYDENGDVTGSSETTLTENTDGSSSSSTTNYDENGDPTNGINQETDTNGNNSSQELTYDDQGNATVSGYEIDTSGSQSGEKTFNGDGVNTQFYGFDVTDGFIAHIHFTINFSQQPAGQDENHHQILTMKRATPEPWYGFQIRQTSTNKYVQLGTQFSTGSNTNTQIPPGRQLSTSVYEYDVQVIYDPLAISHNFECKELITDTTVFVADKLFPDLPELEYLTVCVGYGLNANGNPYRYSNINVSEFTLTKLSRIVEDPVISCDGQSITLTCATSGALIYYRLNRAGSYILYTLPISMNADTYVEAYAIANYRQSNGVEQMCIYDDGLEEPVISCDGEIVTITCETMGADIYYRLGTTGEFIYYDTPIPIYEDTEVYAFADLDGRHSDVVHETCIYEPVVLEAPVISCDGSYITLTCATTGAIIYYRLNQTGNYAVYTGPIEIFADTVIEAYSYLDQELSIIVMDTCIYDPVHDYSLDYLTFNVVSGGTIAWAALGSGYTRTIEYSINNGTWTSITSAATPATITVVAGDKVRFRGTNSTYAGSKSNYSGFDSGTAVVNIEGNIMSLIYGDNFVNNNTLTGSYNFCSIFKRLNIVSAENLILPATTLTQYCYRAMFSWPADDKPSAISVLSVPPALPATTLAKGCYWYMFENCNITEAPDLLATTLLAESYGYMFNGCRNLNYIKCLATNITATNCLQGWVTNVASTGTFVKDGNTTWAIGNSGIPTNWTVYNDDLLAAPTITYDGEDMVTISCDTYGADIYYQLNLQRSYTLYTEPIFIEEDMTVSAYASKDGQSSQVSSQTCIYNPVAPFMSANKDISMWKRSNVDVSVPYSINRTDGHSSNYSKGTFNFDTVVTVKNECPTYLWFQHADQSAEIYVNSSLADTHWGGYNAFYSADLSTYIKKGTNIIRVALTNTTRNTLAPAAGDFNFNATLGYVKLFNSPVFPDPSYGYDGFHVTSLVTNAQATVNVKTRVPIDASVVCTIADSSFNYTETKASTGNELTFTASILNPHLWNGTLDPHLYNITLEIYHDGELYHRFQRPYGLRYYSYVINEPNILPGGAVYTGFLLNGQPYYLRGVCMHEDVEGRANAYLPSDYTQEFNIIQELGCNFIRLAHYPHTKEIYDNCDRLGIIVQTEVPCVNKFQSTLPADYYTHLEGQYRDMVNQHYNHPCIMFWGLSNETTTDDKPFAKSKIESYISLIKSLDQERMVGYVMSHSYNNPVAYYNNPTGLDWVGCNIYVGWYIDKASNDPTSQLNTRVTNVILNYRKALAFSEYGCGGTQHCHSEDPQTTTTKGNYERHDIEYQMWLHEGHIAAIRNFPQLLFTAQWQLFDIAVSNRNEGYTVCLDGSTTITDDNLRRLNNKGLVERDHITKKDTFYLYKAEWNPTPFVHICGKDYTKMTNRVIKCYTNASSSLDLYVNGTFVETATVTDNIALFTSATYQSGDIIRVDGPNSTSDTFTFE